MRAALASAVFVATAAAIAFACSSFESTDNGQSDSGTDATTDVATEDASDASSVDAADASPVFGCARYPDAAFCEDFEDGGLGTETWTDIEIDPADAGVATLSATNDSPISPPHAARIELHGNHGTCYYAHLYRRISGKYKHVRIRTSVKETPSDFGFLSVGSRNTADTVRFTHIVFAATGDLDIKVQSQRGILADGGIDELGIDGRQLDLAFGGRWHDVVVELSNDGADKSLKLTLDAKYVISYTLPEDFELLDPTFDIGPFCSPAGASGTYEFDDVAAWVE